jgi:hypothetical protein
VSTEPDYFQWLYVYLIRTSPQEVEETEYWKRWLEEWKPEREWMQ